MVVHRSAEGGITGLEFRKSGDATQRKAKRGENREARGGGSSFYTTKPFSAVDYKRGSHPSLQNKAS